MVDVARVEASAKLIVERASQVSLGFAVMDVFWNSERVGEVRAGKTAEIKLIPGEGDFQIGMRSLITRRMFLTNSLRLNLLEREATLVRMKADPNLYATKLTWRSDHRRVLRFRVMQLPRKS
jgi:hypothetical protein